MADVWIKEGDTAPVIRRTLLDGNGDAVDINGATVRFLCRRLHDDSGALIAEEAENEQVDEETTGLVSFTAEEGFDRGGYQAEWEVTFADQSIETFPNDGFMTIAVVADLPEPTS